MFLLFAPAIVLATWAGTWALGVRGDGWLVLYVALTAVAYVASEVERQRRWISGRS